MPDAPSGRAVLARFTPGRYDAVATRSLYWRGQAAPDGAGGLAIPAGGTLDLGTWFNAAPVGWWRELLHPRTIRLTVRGSGDLIVYGAGTGRHAGPRRQLFDGRLAGLQVVELPVSPVVDLLWLELHAVGAEGHLASAEWSAQPSPAASTQTRDVRITAVVPTYRREADALQQVSRLLDPELADAVARVVLIDQARTVRQAPGAQQVLAQAMDRLILIEQDNLGGSGGYARGMLESLRYPGDAVLLLDDDAVIEPEGLRRMLALQQHAKDSGIRLMSGTPLLAAEAPARLTALAERVRRGRFQWGTSTTLHAATNLAAAAPDAWSFADPRATTDYSGWWATLLPPGAVAEIGLPAPYFLKWDDAEYGLRAKQAGYRVATVPGTGAWHPTWAAKGTIASWAAWPLHRNRLATAAAHRAGRGVLADAFVHQVKHIVSLQYTTADLWNAATEQFLAGPGWLGADLRTVREHAQAVVDGAPQRAAPAAGTDRAVPGAGPAAGAGTAADPGTAAGAGSARLAGPGGAGPGATGPARPARAPSRSVWRGLLLGIAGLCRANRATRTVRVAASEFGWRTGLGQDVVILDQAPAQEDSALVRDPRRARAVLLRAARLHARAFCRWSTLRRAYAQALPRVTSADHWKRTFEQ